MPQPDDLKQHKFIKACLVLSLLEPCSLSNIKGTLTACNHAVTHMNSSDITLYKKRLKKEGHCSEWTCTTERLNDL